MFIGYDFKAVTKVSALLDGLSGWVTYLDTCSVGQTADFQNSLKMMAKSILECKKILNSGNKIVDLPSEFSNKSVGSV